MKKIISPVISFSLFIAALLLASASPLSGQTQKPRVAVLPLEVQDSGNIQLQVISERTSETASLALRFMDEYELVKAPPSISAYDIETLRLYCQRESVDSLLYGKTTQGDDDSFTIEMSVFSRETETTTLTRRETADTALDIFDAADRITLSLIEGFSGRHIAFGSIAIEFAKDRGSFIPYIDGEIYPAGTMSFPQILTGERTLTVTQERMFGTATIFSDTVTVREGVESVVRLGIPYLLDAEKEALSGHEKTIERYSDNRKRKERVEEAYDSIESLLSDTSYNESLTSLREKYSRERKAWEERLASEPEREKREIIAGFHGGMSVSMLNRSEMESDGNEELIYPDTQIWNDQANTTPLAGFDLQIQLFNNLYLQLEYNKRQLVFYREEPDDHYLMVDEIPVMLKYMFKSGNNRLSVLMGFSFSTITEYSGFFEYGSEISGVNDFELIEKGAFGATFGLEYSHRIDRHILSAAIRVVSTPYVRYFYDDGGTSEGTDITLRADTLDISLGYGYNFGGSGNIETEESRKKWLIPFHVGYLFPSSGNSDDSGSPVLTGGILYGFTDNLYLGATVLGFRDGGAPMLSAAFTKDRDRLINNVSAIVLPMFEETIFAGTYTVAINSLSFGLAAGGPLQSFFSDGVLGILFGYCF